jgi:hypothetical protein
MTGIAISEVSMILNSLAHHILSLMRMLNITEAAIDLHGKTK